MAFRKFLDKHVWTILTIIGIIVAIVIFATLRIDATRDIDDQIKELYDKEKLVEQDFSNAHSLSGVVCYINEASNVVILNAKDCSLKVAYNKNGELLTKEFVDNRIGASFFVCIVIAIAAGFLACFVCGFGLALLDTILAKVEEKKLTVKRYPENTDKVV